MFLLLIGYPQNKTSDWFIDIFNHLIFPPPGQVTMTWPMSHPRGKSNKPFFLYMDYSLVVYPVFFPDRASVDRMKIVQSEAFPRLDGNSD